MLATASTFDKDERKGNKESPLILEVNKLKCFSPTTPAEAEKGMTNARETLSS
jgi:hypothetical protein